MLTRKKLERFVKLRNKSDFVSNMQFQIDAEICGFNVKDLGEIRKFQVDGFSGYEWKPIVSKQEQVLLVEFGRRLYLQGQDDFNTRSMFELMDKAKYIRSFYYKGCG